MPYHVTLGLPKDWSLLTFPQPLTSACRQRLILLLDGYSCDSPMRQSKEECVVAALQQAPSRDGWVLMAPHVTHTWQARYFQLRFSRQRVLIATACQILRLMDVDAGPATTKVAVRLTGSAWSSVVQTSRAHLALEFWLFQALYRGCSAGVIVHEGL